MVDAVVALVVTYVNIVGTGELLEVALGCDGFFAGGCLLVTAVHVFCDTINKQCGATVAAFATLSGMEQY